MTLTRIADRRRLVRERHAQSAPSHELFLGLLKTLPESSQTWDSEARAAWLQLAASMFDVVYGQADKDIVISGERLK